MGGRKPLSLALATAALAMGGCYLEAGIGYYPRVAQSTDATVDDVGTQIAPATKDSGSALGLVLNVGFYFDVPIGMQCLLGCAPYSVGIGRGGTSLGMIGEDPGAIGSAEGTGTEIRVDADLPRRSRGNYKLRATASYGSASKGDVHFLEVAQDMGESATTTNDGHRFFGGLTYSRKENFYGFTLGLAHLTWDTEARTSNGYIPATHITATGAQFRVVIAFPSATLMTMLGFLDPDPPETTELPNCGQIYCPHGEKINDPFRGCYCTNPD